MTRLPAKKIGTEAEMAVVDYLSREDVPAHRVVRNALQGTHDLGDIWYWTSGQAKVCVSVKGGHAAEHATPEQVRKWLIEADSQGIRAAADAAFVVTKRAGVGRPRAELWRAHMFASTLALRPHDAVVTMALADAVEALAYSWPVRR